MVALRRQILLKTFKLFDLAVMVFAAGLAALLTMGQVRLALISEFFSMRVKVGNFLIAAGLLILWHALFVRFGLYRSHRLSSRKREVVDVVKASLSGSLLLSGFALLFHIRMATPVFLFFFCMLSTAMLVEGRLILRAVLKQTRLHGRNLRHVLIVGSNARAVEIAKKLESRPDLGYLIVGFVDQHWAGCTEFSQGCYQVVCDLEGLPAFLRKNVVDEVVIALPIRSLHDDAARVAALCEEQGITVRLLSNLFNLKLARAYAEDLNGDSFITHDTGNSDDWALVVKRIVDLSCALVGLIFTAPLIAIAAVLIKWTSPGPVFFTQWRVGQNKRRFRMYKLRTMVADAEKKMPELEHLNEAGGPVFKIKNDPRITSVGRFLRKTSIDEIPQLFNVLKGDMSLVGPRPLPLRDYEGFSEDWHRRRLSVRPGITCLWQVNGRSSIPFEQWMELDLQYIDQWSLLLDLQILARTIPAIWKGVGAA